MGKYDHLKTEEDIYHHLFWVAESTLKSRGLTATEHVYTHPRQSILQLANLLKNNVTPVGLTIAIYKEAVSKGLIRQIAKELLFRKIIQEYPDGWTSFDEIGPIVTLVDWVYTFKSNVKTSLEIEHANRIYSDIARDVIPPEGWKPESADDLYLIELFNRNWPVDVSTKTI